MLNKLLILTVFLVTLSYAQVIGPKMFTPADTYDYGTILEGETVKHKFIIVNNGGSLLKIDNVVSSCGCTVADPEIKELKPGESTHISVEFNTSGRFGEQIKTIAVMSNDESNPVQRFTIKGKVLEQKTEVTGPVIKFDRAQYDFGVVEEGGVLTHSFVFTNTGTEPLEIVDIRTSCGCTAAHPDKKIYQPGEKGVIKAEFDTKGRVGRNSRTITVINNDVNNAYFILSIYAEVKGKES